MRVTSGASEPRPSCAYHQLVLENALLSAPLFKQLSAHQISKLVAVGRIKVLDRSERLFSEGEISHGLYIVQSGAIRMYRMNARGHEQVVHIARAGESFAEESLFAERCYQFNAAAVQPSRVIVLPRNELLSILRSCPDLLLRLTVAVSKHLCEMIGLLDDLRLKSARVRLGRWLLHRIADPLSHQSQSVTLTIPKKALAAELGMVSETFSRVLAELQSEHLLLVHGRTLIVHDPAELSVSLALEENECNQDVQSTNTHTSLPPRREFAVMA
ncbi:MAG: Crp/Fnr family transcriptional regulator [Limisphaerales bacterium]